MTTVKRIPRTQAIADLRAALLELVDDEHSICEVAAERGIFCGGFSQWTFHELKKQYPTIVRSRPRLTPKQLKELANRWQLVRKEVLGTDLACDTQLEEHRFQTCKGWNEWPNEDLARFHFELCGEEVEVVPDADAS